MTQGVWVTRPGAPGERTCRAVVDHGYTALHVPLLEIVFSHPGPPARPAWADVVVFVSANAVEGLRRAAATAGFPKPAPFRAAVIGRKTLQKLEGTGWAFELAAEDSNAAGLLDKLKQETFRGARVWIPAGNRAGSARTTLPAAFREGGAVVEILPVYATLDREPTEEERDRLSALEPGGITIHSPSAAESFCAAAAHSELAPWWEAGATIAIGATTAARLHELGAPTVHECQDPSDAGVVAVLDSLSHLQESRS